MSVPATLELNLNRNFTKSILMLLEDVELALPRSRNIPSIIKAFRNLGTAEIDYSAKMARAALDVIEEVYNDTEISENLNLKLNVGFLNTRRDCIDLVEFLEELAKVSEKHKVR